MEIGIIGYGRMGSSLAKGMARAGIIPTVYDLDESKISKAKEDGIKSVKFLSDLNKCNVIIIAVKPKDFAIILEEIKKNLNGNKLFISIAAGITISFMEFKLGKNTKIIRAMPNIAASIGESISVLVRNANVTDDEINLARRIFESVGIVLIADDENILDVITGISGSGPAYFFLIMKIMSEIGEEYGLPKEMSRKLVAQTCKAAGILALSSKEDFQYLINLVASPGGTTEEAINVMISKGLQEVLRSGIIAAIEKSKKLSIH